jgi:hypothetical protein
MVYGGILMRGNFKKMITRVVSFLFLSQAMFFSLVRAEGTKDTTSQAGFAVSFVYIIMAGAMVASGVLFVNDVEESRTMLYNGEDYIMEW